MKSYQWSLALLAVLTCAGAVRAQDSAPSSHFVFDDGFEGDIIINEVRVPKSGEAMYTYYEALGWSGGGAGYAGIQVHPRAHNFIFSIWDHKSHTAPIKAVYRGPGTETKGFGGEGTGLKSWNFKLGWSTDVWYTLVARNWPVGEHTYYGFWVRAGDSKKWTHLVTMDVGTANAHFKGSTDAFIEDWLNTGAKPRTTNLRRGWKRKIDGTWFPFGAARYSVNSWDLVSGKRSYNYRSNWNGGTSRDATGDYYFMTSGGAKTAATTANPSRHAIERKETRPDYDRIAIGTMQLTLKDPKTLSVAWANDETTVPQFSYQIEIHDNRAGKGVPLVSASRNVPHAREEALDVSSLRLSDTQYYLHLQCNDILDRKSDAKVAVLGKALLDSQPRIESKPQGTPCVGNMVEETR
ncbi:MAG: DUF3472 domain-containing protein [Candidatus Nealsonbacteria bacterium]|nr:DUF3472 domain-containing protein [Candidatus Nealsonbacteria bacterium]